jgi:LuxR family maltose regulon positive regulatory protein
MIPILETKLRIPDLPAQQLSRPKLVHKLNDGLNQGRKITLISAPAGFGKSNCTVEWLQTVQLPVSWLSLEPPDDDPGRFFRYWLIALQKLDPAIGHEIAAVIRAGQIPPAEIISTTIINDLLKLTEKSILVLDDVHILQDTLILKVLSDIVSHIPATFHLVIITREDPVLPLARIRAQNQLTEIRAVDLRFNNSESTQFLNTTLGLSLSAKEIAALDNKTEGWVVGLQLAGLTIKDSPDPSAVIEKLSGSHRYVLNYLTEEVLNLQPEEIQDFLLRTSILNQLCSSICDAVTGRNDSRKVLTYLQHANLFLIPMDDGNVWFRFHHLFSELLRDRLNETSKSIIPILHKRAAEWFSDKCVQTPQEDEKIGFASQAIEHAILAEDYRTAVDLIERFAMGMIVEWYSKDITKWSMLLPSEWCAKSIRINLAFAWHKLFHGWYSQALPYLDQVEKLLKDAPASDGLHLNPELLALQAWICNSQGKPAEAIQMATDSLTLIQGSDTVISSLVYLALGGAYMQLGEINQAIDTYQSLLEYGQKVGDISMELIASATLGQLLTFTGQYRKTFSFADRSIRSMEKRSILHPVSIAIFGELADVHYQWNNLDLTREYLDKSVRVSYLSGYPHAAVFKHLVACRLYRRDGDLTSAFQELEKAVALAQQDLTGSLREEVVSEQVVLALLQAKEQDAEAIFLDLCSKWGNFAYSPGGVLPTDYLQGPKEISFPEGRFLDIGLRLNLHYMQKKFDPKVSSDGIRFATDLLAGLLKKGFLPPAVDTYLLRSQQYAAAGEKGKSQEDLIHALEIGEPEGLIGVFLQEGKPIVNGLLALEQAQLTPSLKSYLKRILAAVPATHPSEWVPLRGISSYENLTSRELDVLRLIANGNTYEEIATALFLSINTVRSHVKSLYGKLGVKNRVGALESARLKRLL